jgi:hypothetical protein
MHVHIMQGDPRNPFMQKRSSGCCTRFTGPDLAPGNFFLFGSIKRKLTEYHIPYRQSFKNAITPIFDEIGHKALMAVFETWVNRFKWVI